ncbi:hypothetical protein HRI_003196900 [Hibiscus trionum]|uniref:RRM domain-containing protein n=1 Tax=Hibiscus trionum TaxID=183268 RepID=A0A9W7IHP0_HIBTR|nr:hypothetical protein HRI_003196900 [Hibiscus trionum]
MRARERARERENVSSRFDLSGRWRERARGGKRVREEERGGVNVSSRPHSWGRQARPYPRFGYAVFVTNVSKRIRPNALREAFSVYGKVLRVFIAYHNQKRSKALSTFAFVNFSDKKEAMKAVSLGNNRRLDGFVIKVFVDDRRVKDAKVSKVDSGTKLNRVFRENCRRDGRSYKSVLMANIQPASSGSVQATPAVHPVSKNGQGTYGTPMAVPDEMDKILTLELSPASKWLELCLVGQVKSMYDADCVQQALRADGFKVDICSWSGFYVIIRFEEVEQISIFWDLRSSLISTWFSDIDFLDNFKKEKKLKVWVCMEGLPLHLWDDQVFQLIGRQIGTVVKIDKETSKKTKLDVARVLIAVGCLSEIHVSILVSAFGDTFRIRFSSSAFEDERCWIDGELMNSPFPEKHSFQNEDTDAWINEMSEGMSPKGADSEILLNSLCRRNVVPANPITEVVGLAVGPKSYGVEPDINCFEVSGSDVGTIKPGPGQVGVYPGQPKLVEVPVTLEIGPTISSDISSSCEPTLDKESGLFHIKPKLMKFNGNIPNPLCRRSPLEKPQNWAFLSPKSTPSLGISCRSKEKKVLKPLQNSKHGESGPSNCTVHLPSPSAVSVDDKARQEAMATFEVCESIGLSFAAKKDDVIQCLMDLGEENGYH